MTGESIAWNLQEVYNILEKETITLLFGRSQTLA